MIIMRVLGVLILVSSFLVHIKVVNALTVGPTVTHVKNETRSIATNTTLNESTGGGYIYTYVFDATEQNKRWKAYVGNVTGTLTLDDANSYTIYEWDLGTVAANIYATRNSSTVNWTALNCSWVPTGDYTDRTISQAEDSAMQRSKVDNITATFDARNHSAFKIGDNTLAANTCYTLLPYVNNSQQTDSSNLYFEELLLYDSIHVGQGKVVYGVSVEDNVHGYNGNDPADNATYDFQMLVPEVGLSSWTSSTAYYFYVELL
jgi:hypothetical protein